MTKQEIEKEISDFKNGFVYEPQLTSFEKNLLLRVKDRDLKAFAIAEIKRLKALIKDGINNPTDESGGRMRKRKIKDNSSSAKFEPVLFAESRKNKKEIKIISIESLPAMKIEFDYKGSTFLDLAKYLDVKVEILKSKIKAQDINFEFNPNHLISAGIWLLLEPYVMNFLKNEDAKRKKAEIEKPGKKRVPPRGTPLPEYVGGNFGKLIFFNKKS